MAKNIFSRAAKETKQAAEKHMGDDITMRGTLTAAAIVGAGVNAGKALHDIASKSKKEMQKNTDKNSDVSISEKRTQKEFEKTVDAIRSRYGIDSIKRASFLQKDSIVDHAASKRKHLNRQEDI